MLLLVLSGMVLLFWIKFSEFKIHVAANEMIIQDLIEREKQKAVIVVDKVTKKTYQNHLSKKLFGSIRGADQVKEDTLRHKVLGYNFLLTNANNHEFYEFQRETEQCNVITDFQVQSKSLQDSMEKDLFTSRLEELALASPTYFRKRSQTQ